MMVAHWWALKLYVNAQQWEALAKINGYEWTMAHCVKTEPIK